MKEHLRQDQLFTLYDGALAGAARREADAHLAACLICRETLGQWQRTAKAFFRAPAIHPSEAFVQQLMARIDALARPRQSAPRLTWLRWLVPAVGLAGVLLLIRPLEHAISVETLLLGEESDDVLDSLVEGPL